MDRVESEVKTYELAVRRERCDHQKSREHLGPVSVRDTSGKVQVMIVTFRARIDSPSFVNANGICPSWADFDKDVPQIIYLVPAHILGPITAAMVPAIVTYGWERLRPAHHL